MATVKYYQDFETEFAESRRQDYVLPDDYVWERDALWWRVGGGLLHGLVLLIDAVYRLIAHEQIKNRRILRKMKGGYYLYANHTQVFGDVVSPYALCWPKRPRVICSPANLGIPVIGPWLPLAGALPIPEKPKMLKAFTTAVLAQYQKKRAVVIYPEGRVWPYYTGIRPFQPASFHFPAKNDAPVFVATTIYRKKRFGKRPKICIVLDGPFKAPTGLARKVKQAWLEQTVRETMLKRAKESDYRYIIYRRKA